VSSPSLNSKQETHSLQCKSSSVLRTRLSKFRRPAKVLLTPNHREAKRKRIPETEKIDLDSDSTPVAEETTSKKPLVRSHSNISINSLDSYITYAESTISALPSPTGSIVNIPDNIDTKHMTTGCIEDMYQEYVTYSVDVSRLPRLSNPPDKATKIPLKEMMTPEEKIVLRRECQNVLQLASPNHMLLTLSSKGFDGPPCSHLIWEMPRAWLDMSYLDSIPIGPPDKIIVEILLHTSFIEDYLHHLVNIIKWWTLKQKKLLIITVPKAWRSNLHNFFTQNIYEIPRPFQLTHSSLSTT
jgi:hypothetical protein